MTNNRESKDQLISQLKKDWQQLENISSHTIPDKASIIEQLAIAKAAKRKAFYKELALFIMIALLILTALTTIVFKAPFIFLWTQILSAAAAPMVYLVLNKRKAKEADTYDR